MGHKVFLGVVLLLCLVSLAVPTGCRSAYAQGSYPRIGHVRLDELPEAPRSRIASVIEGHADPIARGQALWHTAEQFERQDTFRAALVAYQEASATGALPAQSVRRSIRRCRARLAVDSRWADADLRRTATAMDASRGLGLFREIVRTVAGNYVDDIPYGQLLEAGLDNLQAAVTSPVVARQLGLSDAVHKRATFLSALGTIRRELREEKRMSSFVARYYVRRACEENRQTLGLPDGVVISEFIFGAAEHLDAYSIYLTRDMYTALKEDLTGSFVGLGIEVRSQANRLLIVNVFDGGPASSSGLHAGDVITGVDGADIAGAGLDRIVKLLRGKKGTTVKVTVKRGENAMSFAVTRDTIEVPSVRHAVRLGDDDAFAYIQVSNFQRTTGAEVSRALDVLEKQARLRGVILDLRGNPGGLVDAAVQVSSLFLDSGAVVTTKGRGFGQTRTYRVSHWRYDYHDHALVVLMDNGSASASEIVAAAMKDHKRATLVGQRSYGKGIVQSILPVEAGQSAVYLTTARFVGPAGTSFHGVGLTPDVVVPTPQSPRIRTGQPCPQADAALAKALEILAVKTAQPVARRTRPTGELAARLTSQ